LTAAPPISSSPTRRSSDLADPTNGLNSELAHLIGPPGPTEGVVNSIDDARQAVRQRYKEGSDVVKITATGGVLSYAKSGDAPQRSEEHTSELQSRENLVCR